MLLVSHQRDPFSPIERRSVEWGVGCTARELAPEWWTPEDGCSRNGGGAAVYSLLADGDHVHYWTRPGFQIGFLYGLLLFAGTFLIQKLLLPAKKPVDPGDATSPTYAFAGLRNNARGEGNAIPVLYGRHRVTPPIINEYIRSSFDTNGNPVSEYLAEMLISEGPINKIGDKTADDGPFSKEIGNFLQTLQINGQPAENFEGVEAHVRMGSTDQEPIAETANPVVSREVGLVMEDPASTLTHATTTNDAFSSTTAIAQAGAFAAGNINITKWDGDTSLVSFVGSDLADEFTVALEFPQGLISFLADGTPQPNSLLYQIRYVRVDDGGTPFGNFIVLAAQKAELTRQGLLGIELRNRTYDPSFYTAPQILLFLESRAAGNTGASVFIDTTKFQAPAPASTRFSVALWVKRRTAMLSGQTGMIWQWKNSGGTAGFWMTASKSGSIGTVSGSIGTGVGAVQVFTHGTLLNPITEDTTNWHHIVFTYEANFDGSGNQRARYYRDGVLITAGILATLPTWDVSQQIRVGANAETSPSQPNDCHYDEVTFWSKTLTPYDVANLYNGGNPLAVDPLSDGLIIGAEFDSNEGTTPNIGSPSFGPAAFTTLPNRTWRLGTGTGSGTATNPVISTSSGIVRAQLGLNIPLRSKWRVDVLRLDTEETSQRFISEVSWKEIQWRTFTQFEHPGMAKVMVKVPATDQLSGAAPVLSVIAEGKLVPVWDGVDPVYPQMPPTYSTSPAWVATDMALAVDYGIGSIYKPTDCDVSELQALATYSDTRIYDNGPRQVLISARQIESADTGTDANMAIVLEDCVRYRLDRLPTNFPQATAGKVSTGKYLTCKITGTPSPAVPAWLTTEIAAGAQEVIFVTFDSATSDFFVYCKSSAAVGASSALYTPGVSGTNYLEVERHDVRFRFDGYFDRADTDAWDAITQVLQTARAAPMRIGSRLSVFTDRPSSRVALFGMGNIIEGSWQSSFQGTKDRPTAESAEFFDEEKNYERDVQPDRHPDLVDPSNERGALWRRMRVEGVTRRGQIKRSIRRDLNAYALLKRAVEFEVGIDGLAARPGDVVGVSHDVPGYGYSGRVWENATVGTSIKLDREIVLALATSYQVQIVNAASELRETKAVTSGAGTYAAGAAITVGGGGFSFLPDKDDMYALGDVTKGEVKDFRLLEVTLNPKALRLRLKLLEYNSDVYLDDFGTLPEVSTTTLPAPSAPTVPAGVQNLVVSEVTARGPDGSVRIAALVSFEHFQETYHAVGSTDVYVSRGTHEQGIGSAKLVATLPVDDTDCEIGNFNFARDETYTVWIIPKTRDGATAYRAFASFQEITPSGLAPMPDPLTSFTGQMSGEQFVYEWEGDIDHGATVEVRRGGWILGVPMFAVPAQSRQHATRDWANGPVNAFGVNAPDLVARVKLRTGQYSAATVLVATPSLVVNDGLSMERSEEDFNWS